MKKNNSFKQNSIALFTIVLLCSNILVQANISIDSDIKKNQNNVNESSSSSSVVLVSHTTFGLIFEEDFTDGNMPPVDPELGQWVLTTTANDATWFIDNSNPYSNPYSATIHRGDYKGLQDEWLITPSINLSSYDVINLRFRWFTSRYAAVDKDEIDLNVGVSLDNGSSWTVIWNEDNAQSCISWIWEDSEAIPLSNFARESNVRIGFHYYSNNISNNNVQLFSIDDVQINANSKEIICDAGGPYEISWSWNKMYGVQFHGKVDGGQPPYLNWTWDFGDGHTSKLHNPIWIYNDIGTYNVTLTVSDSAKPYRDTDTDYTTVKVVETPPTCVKITILNSIGITAQVENTGTLNISYLNWSMTIDGALLKGYHREVGNGIISYIKPKTSQIIQSTKNFIWFGLVTATIEVKPLNACRVEIQQRLFIMGLYVVPFQSFFLKQFA